MIVKARYDQLTQVPQAYLLYGPDTKDKEELALSIGKHYIVYAVRSKNNPEVKWFLVYTDNGYLWWMPADAFEIVDTEKPKGWVEEVGPGGSTWSYPSLHEWKIEEGIIDRDKEAENTYLHEVKNDPTFPAPAALSPLNEKFEMKQRWAKYEQELRIAKENGWERPEKPNDLDG